MRMRMCMRMRMRMRMGMCMCMCMCNAYPDHSVSPQQSYPAPHTWRTHPYDPSGPCHGWLLAR